MVCCFHWKLEIRGSQDPCLAVARPANPPPRGFENVSFFHYFFDAFCNRFLIALGSIFHPNLAPKTHQNPSKIDAKRGSILSIDFWFDFGANMPPFSLRKSIKIASKLELGRHRFFDWFLHWYFIDFPSIWDANLELCWPLRLLQDASKTPPRRLPRRSARHVSLQR